MKASEKKIIFNLLKTASDNFYGYNSPAFEKMPEFTDDPEPAAKNKLESDRINADMNKSENSNSIPAEKIEINKTETENTQDAQQLKPSSEPHRITMKDLAEKTAECKNCPLCNGRRNSVPGQGVEHPSVLVIGEGPGEEEDKQGLPFVGPAGQLLDKMLASIQLDRNINCYIANTVKCRPPYNRAPHPEEAAACRSFLDAQIHILKPKMILLVGKVALRNLMNIQGEISLRRYRGQIYEYNGIPTIVTYHPSALLRNTDYKRPTWEDLKFFKSKLLELSPDYAKNFPVQK